MRVAIAVAIGLLLGAGARGFSPPSVEPPTTTTTTPPAVTQPVVRCPPTPVSPGPAPDPAPQIDEERLRLREAIAEVQGYPSPWPDEVPAELEPEALERALREAAPVVDASLVELDCGEFPCVAVLSAPGPDAMQLAKAFEARGLATAVTAAVQGDAAHIVLAPLPDDASAEVRYRLQWRVERLNQPP